MRLLIVSNRLPVTIFDEDGELVARPSAGGLVTGLGAYLDAIKREAREYVWIGWPGIDLPEHERNALEEQLASKHNAHPFAGKANRHSASHAAARTGDNGHLVFEFLHRGASFRRSTVPRAGSGRPLASTHGSIRHA